LLNLCGINNINIYQETNKEKTFYSSLLRVSPSQLRFFTNECAHPIKKAVEEKNKKRKRKEEKRREIEEKKGKKRKSLTCKNLKKNFSLMGFEPITLCVYLLFQQKLQMICRS
jgi:hypothetical protein